MYEGWRLQWIFSYVRQFLSPEEEYGEYVTGSLFCASKTLLRGSREPECYGPGDRFNRSYGCVAIPEDTDPGKLPAVQFP